MPNHSPRQLLRGAERFPLTRSLLRFPWAQESLALKNKAKQIAEADAAAFEVRQSGRAATLAFTV